MQDAQTTRVCLRCCSCMKGVLYGYVWLCPPLKPYSKFTYVQYIDRF